MRRVRIQMYVPRRARVVFPGLPHHVTQRGNNRQQLFFAPEDYRYSLELLADQARPYLFGETFPLIDNHHAR